jgi:hypothetical protein
MEESGLGRTYHNGEVIIRQGEKEVFSEWCLSLNVEIELQLYVQR